MKPLHDYVLIKPTTPEEKVGSIVLPESSQEKPQTGIVLAAGVEANAVKIGDKVLFAKYGGTTIEHDGEELLLIKEEHLLAVVE